MTFAIIYATNSGGTQQAAMQIAEQLHAAKHTVNLKRAYEAKPEDLQHADVVILGSCTWLGKVGEKMEQGQLQEHMQEFVDRVGSAKYPGLPCAVFGLGDSSYTHFCAAADHLVTFVERIGGQLLGQPLRFDGYYFDLPQSRLTIERWIEDVQRKVPRK
ncbi:MAG: flavodoxin family protein [Candidatus Kerfeldbacteria bacterium]|nr:flavodoxin family protein [Candidatus Kerfeldbacteria bacterium]